MLPGWTVSRDIPREVFFGLAAGQYTLHGGVVRGAAGTPFAGQIIRHLIPVAQSAQSIAAPVNTPFGIINAVNSFRVFGNVSSMSRMTTQLLQIATGTMITAGLNLLVASVGFLTMNQRIAELESTLSQLQKDVREIKTLLELNERARLHVALRDLMHLDQIPNDEHRHTILHNVRLALGEINLKYHELLTGNVSLETSMGYEEYFCLTGLAQVRCTAELGMLTKASTEFEEMMLFWQSQAQRIAQEHILKPNPERFLASDFVDDVPSAILVDWLDFAMGEEKGYAWIDELRRETKPWYSEGRFQMPTATLKGSASKFKREQNLVIPAMQRLVSRDKVLTGYISQYQLLAEQNITPSEFERRLARVEPEMLTDGYLILEPEYSLN